MKGTTAPPMKKKGFMKSFFGLDSEGAKMGPMEDALEAKKPTPKKPSIKSLLPRRKQKGLKPRWMV